MSSKNRVCLLDSREDDDGSVVNRLLTELTGCTENDVISAGKTLKWSINNKYYETEVFLEVKGHLEADQGAWQAVINICDPTASVSVKRAYSIWEELEPEATPPVNLLVGVVSGCGLKEEVRKEIIEWCLDNGVEYIEWNLIPQPSADDGEDEFPESVGVARISEALQAHIWPVMSLKSDTRGGGGESGSVGGACGGIGSQVSDKQETKSSDEVATSPEARLDELVGAREMEDLVREGEVEEFESLFSKFADMKAHAQSLPHEERKAYAEKVVMSFWKAIGGDEDEIDSENES